MQKFIFTVTGLGLEGPTERALLQALGRLADGETGFVRGSKATLAAYSGLKVRTVARTLARLAGEDRGRLVLIVDPPRKGPGASGLYLVDWERLHSVSQAFSLAHRQIHAGASVALDEAGLLGEPASPANCLSAMVRLRAALLAERKHAAADRVLETLRKLKAHLASWPENTLGLTSEIPALPSLMDNAVSDADAAADIPITVLTPELVSAIIATGRKDRLMALEALQGCLIFEIDRQLHIRTESQRHHDRVLDAVGWRLTDCCLNHPRWTNYAVTIRQEAPVW